MTDQAASFAPDIASLLPPLSTLPSCPMCHSIGVIHVDDPTANEWPAHWSRCFKCLHFWERLRP